MIESGATSQKIEDMIDYAGPLIERWPKVHKLTLGVRILDKMYDMAELATAADLKYFNKSTLRDLDVANHSLLKLVRRANRIRYKTRTKDGTEKEIVLLNSQHYETWSKKIIEIGNLIGGWIEKVKDRKQS